jgi:hypothetical protein
VSGNHPSSNKRLREEQKSRKKQEKARRRAEKRAMGPREIPVQSAADAIRDLPSTAEAMRAMEARAGAPREASTIPVRLFVGGLTSDTTAEHLREAFQRIGRVADAIVVVDRETRVSRGFGFVTLADRKDGPRAISELDGSDLRGATIVVNAATERGR